MTPPSDNNTRAALIWQQVLPAIDFEGKTVVDLGCGGGDFLWRAWDAGAVQVTGYDKDEVMMARVRRELSRTGYAMPKARIELRYADLNRWPEIGKKADIAFCFSVLPYLDDIEGFLRSMSLLYATSFIECQYWGDGPGLSIFQNDADMKEYLSNFWPTVVKVGFTRISGRNAIRSIWKVN